MKAWAVSVSSPELVPPYSHPRSGKSDPGPQLDQVMDVLSDLRELLLTGLPGSGPLTSDGYITRRTGDNTCSDFEPENLHDILSRGTNMLKAPERLFSFYDSLGDTNNPVQTADSQGGFTSDTLSSTPGASCLTLVTDNVVSLPEPPQATTSEPVRRPKPTPQASSDSGPKSRCIDIDVADQGKNRLISICATT